MLSSCITITIFFGIVELQACLWDYFGDIRHTELVDSDQTLEESHLQMDQVVCTLRIYLILCIIVFQGQTYSFLFIV